MTLGTHCTMKGITNATTQVMKMACENDES
jgi:hypothetical protein